MMCHSLHLICSCKSCIESFVSWLSIFKSEKLCWPFPSFWPSPREFRQLAGLSGLTRLALQSVSTRHNKLHVNQLLSTLHITFYLGKKSFHKVAKTETWLSDSTTTTTNKNSLKGASGTSSRGKEAPLLKAFSISFVPYMYLCNCYFS